MDIKWCPFLNNNEKGLEQEGKVLLHGKGTPIGNELIVCKELKFRSFAKFPNILAFSDYLFSSVKEEEKCFYEYIFSGQSQKPYFDLDIPLDKTVGKKSPTTVVNEKIEGCKILKKIQSNPEIRPEKVFMLTKEEAETAVSILVETIMKLYPQITQKNIMIFNSHGEHKLSYHVIVDNFCFTSASGNRNFFNKIMETYPDCYKPAIDASMYKSVQAFRMFSCHKFANPERIKKLDKLSKWYSETERKFEIDEIHKNKLIFFSSLITNTKDCNVLSDFPGIEKRKKYISDIVFDDEIINAALELCVAYENNNSCYSIRTVDGRIISLQRNCPSYCNLCERTHENENPFLYICSDGTVTFNCNRRQNEKVKYISIGNVSSVGNVISLNKVENVDIIEPIADDYSDNAQNFFDDIEVEIKNDKNRSNSSEETSNESILSKMEKISTPKFTMKIKPALNSVTFTERFKIY